MAFTRTALAEALLPHASDQSVVDMLFTNTKNNPQPTLPVSPELARKYYKKTLPQVLAIAGLPGTDPEILALFTKDMRVSVREALLCNPSLPHAQTFTLTDWAAEREDARLVRVGMSRLDPESVVTVLERQSGHLAKGSQYGWTGSFASVVSGKVRGNRDLSLRALACSVLRVNLEILTDVHAERTPDLSLTEALHAMIPKQRDEALKHVLSESGVLTCELAGLIIEACQESRSFGISHDEITVVEPGSLPVLAAGNLDMFALAVQLGLGEKDALAAILKQPSTAFDKVADSYAARKYSASFEQHLIELIAKVPQERSSTADVSTRLLRLLRHRLPDRTLMSWLRSQSLGLTLSWVSSTAGTNSPQPGQLTALVAERGHAFSTWQRGKNPASGEASNTASPLSDEDVATRLTGMLYQITSNPGTTPEYRAEVMRVLDESIGSGLGTSACGAIAMPHIEAALGTQAQAWETLFTLATDWSGGLEQLIESSLLLSGCERAQAPVVEPQDTPLIAVQELLAL
jgi:hypothetical protein